MAGTETEKSKSGSLEAEEELREEMGQREEGRRRDEQNDQQDLNQGMATGTHSSAYGGIHWGPSYRMRSKIEQALPTKEQIKARAYELYLQRHRTDGQDLEDWLIAEQELKQEGRKAMPELEVEKPGVVPASETIDSEITSPHDQDRPESENPPPKPGRLPARASRGWPNC